jgi:predicted O-methyltransferase YrrM
MSNWWQRSDPEAVIALPWLAPNVIEFLESLLTPEMKVCEHGSGGSTLWFAERVKHVSAYEVNKSWSESINAARPANVNMRYARTCMKELDANCDLLLIDGEPLADRRDWLMHAPNIVKPGGWVVLDNANRPDYAIERDIIKAAAAEVKTFDGNQPGTLYLVTEFYRMPK